MRTSNAIKSRQYRPIEPLTKSPTKYTFASESEPGKEHATHRAKSRFSCSCRAVGLCKHITKMVLDAADAKDLKASVWTSKADADRQKKKAVQFTANGRQFWVTFCKPTPRTVEQELQATSDELVRWRRRWYATGDGAIKAEARQRMAELNDEIERLMKRKYREAA